MKSTVITSALGAAVVGSILLATPALAATTPSSSSHTGTAVTQPVKAKPAAPKAQPVAPKAKPAAPKAKVLVSAATKQADAVIAAWSKGDRAAVEKLAVREVTERLFKLEPKGTSGWVEVAAFIDRNVTSVDFVNRKDHELVGLGVRQEKVTKTAKADSTLVTGVTIRTLK